jgi:predicted transglutaminase-like cysteine proteinase
MRSIFSWFKPKPKFTPKTAQELVDGLSGNLDKIANWVYWKIWYRTDKDWKDEWKPSEKTLADKAGDCEDFAVLFYDILRILRYDPKIVAYYPKKGIGHAVCFYVNHGGKWCMFSNSDWKQGLFGSSWTAFKEYALPTAVIWRECDTKGNTKQQGNC